MVPLLDTSVCRGQKTEMDLIDTILQSDWYFFGGGGMNKWDYYNTRCKMWCHVTRPNIMDLLWPGWQSGETQVKTWWGPYTAIPTLTCYTFHGLKSQEAWGAHMRRLWKVKTCGTMIMCMCVSGRTRGTTSRPCNERAGWGGGGLNIVILPQSRSRMWNF